MFSVEVDLLEYLRREEVEVREAELEGLWGYYDHARRRIFIQSGMTQGYRVATLMHEALHHHFGHDGPQPESVEEHIDEVVAERLVDPVAYGFWESQYGWSTGGIASELGLPRWVVSAFRRSLAKGLAKSRV